MNGHRHKPLKLNFHGRIIDSLGIQMYQSPVAAVAELIANAWDADASEVGINLPGEMNAVAEIVVQDNGTGMTFADCQDRYLNVGRNRRLSDSSMSPGGRPLLGRKGIGKFAGFGIARIFGIETISAVTGERTVFALDLDTLRSDEFVSSGAKEIEVLAAEEPDEARRALHGTRIRLRALAFTRRLATDSFLRSMARRFVLARQSSPFHVTVNGVDLPEEADPIGNSIEFSFPAAYQQEERPDGVTTTADGWGGGLSG